MIRKNLLQLIFSGSYLWRWNDKLRPVELCEIEKQAHKMLVACILWNQATLDSTPAERMELGQKIIEGALFDYFYRLIITDIKPPVFYRIKENREHYEQLTRYVLGKLESRLAPLGDFWKRMEGWHLQEGVAEDPDRRILSAAHLYASYWEFKLIKPLNPFDDEMDHIENWFKKALDNNRDLPGMAQILDHTSALGKFANLCGQLRFQIRWTQAPRIPATSVLGHMFIVACCAYLYSLEIGAGQARLCNNFFSGLFHDFPEVLTRDIISPVKQSVSGLSNIIREYEGMELERRVLAPLREADFVDLARRVSYYLGLEVGSEFAESAIINGRPMKIEGRESLKKYDTPACEPKDGDLLKVCDLLSAFLEAHNSIRLGISSPHLQEAQSRLKAELEKKDECYKLDALLSDFD